MDSPVGPLTLISDGAALTHLLFGTLREQTEPDDVLTAAKNQLSEYFSGQRRAFSVPLNPHGTEFQQRVWRALRGIPYGTTASYADIARAIGSPKAFRAVGQANHVNPIPILIPCHRVVGANGALTGYAGGLNVKQALLSLEKRG